MRNLDLQQQLGLAGIEATRQTDLASIDAQRAMYLGNVQAQVQTQQIIANASKSKNKTNVIGALLAGLSVF